MASAKQIWNKAFTDTNRKKKAYKIAQKKEAKALKKFLASKKRKK